MIKLTKEQRISNYNELIASKSRKIENLQQELIGLRNKILKLESQVEEFTISAETTVRRMFEF